MAARAVIPPLCVDPVPGKQSYDMLESRLKAAETDTKQLIEQLGSMGFETPADKSNSNSGPLDFVSPFKGQVSSANHVPTVINQDNYERFKSNYEMLVTRVCKNESALQTLKLNLVNVQGDRNLNQKQENRDIKEKFQFAREAYEQEIGKLTRQVEYLKEELGSEVNSREKAKHEVQQLYKQLEHSKESTMEAAMTAEGLNMSQQKLQKRISDLKEEVTREQSLRSSLEESHNTLLTRVREMENVVEMERSGVKNMSTEYAQTKAECDMLREKMATECHRKQVAEANYKMLCDEKEDIALKYETVDSDREVLMGEVTKLREQYEDLIKQMEQTQTIIDKQQGKNKELIEENDSLTAMLHKVTEENETASIQMKRELESDKKKLKHKEAAEEEAQKLKDNMADLTQENMDFRKKIKRSEDEIGKLKSRICTKDEEFTQTAEDLDKELQSLRDQLKQQQKDRDKILKDKESLLEEVNQTVDSMVAERTKLEKQVQQQQLDLDSHSRARRKLEHENAHLLERISGFEQQQWEEKQYGSCTADICRNGCYQQAQKHVESTLKEMMDQKNKLAYENGRLQTQLEQANQELEPLRKADLESTKYKQLADALADKYTQCESEISELKVTIQRQDSQLKQAHTKLDSRCNEFSSVSVVKEELVKENQRLLTKLQSCEEREKRKVKALQKNNEDGKAVNKEIAATLESVMGSHSQLQSVVESLQVELGKRDTQINRLKNEKNREQQEWKSEMKRFEERMGTTREELRQERDKSHRKNTKDIEEIKRQNDSLSSRNMELMKTNTELRQKTRDQDSHVHELKDKLADQKRKLEYWRRSKADVEENVKKVKEMKADIEELEALRDKYISKNEEQAEMISTFMAQINSLQTELRQLAHAQSQAADLVTQKEKSLEKERKLKEEIRRKYKASKKKEDDLDQMKSQAEKRLNEVKEESLEISNHLRTAHQWFKDKFDNLQDELHTSRSVQERLENENQDQKRKLDGERKKAQAAAEKARDMIKASRQTISRLSDYADIADSETKEQLTNLYRQLEKEKDHSKYMKVKHDRYKEASARQFEQMLNDTEDSYS